MCGEEKKKKYECKSCGKESEKRDECCGEEMKEKSSPEGTCSCE